MKPLLRTRAREALLRFNPAFRRLRERAHAQKGRPPLILVPSILGVRLADSEGRSLWSSPRDLYRARPLAEATEVRPLGLLEEFSFIPGLWAYDVYGAFMRFLERAGGYRRNEDLFVLEYDWRNGIANAAGELERLVDRVRGASQQTIDLVGLSTGGLIARYYAERADGIRRIVYIGTPQRGSFHVLPLLVEGVQPAPFGRRFAPRDIATFQTAWDGLPHPDDRVFVDREGRALSESLYDSATWERLGWAHIPRPERIRRLDEAKRLHQTFDRMSSHPDVFVIGGRNKPTAVRILKDGERVVLPPPVPDPKRPELGVLYALGDGSLPEASLRGLPGLEEERIWWVAPCAHTCLPAEPDVHRLVLEALLAPARAVSEKSAPTESVRVAVAP